MATTYTTYSNDVPGSFYEKPVVTETTITQTNMAPTTVVQSYGKVLNLLAALTGVALFVGAALMLVGAALAIADPFFHYTAIGVLFVVGFGVWCLASLLGLGSSGGLFKKELRNGYMAANLVSNLAFLAGSVCLVLFAAFWLTNNLNVRYAGEILGIIGSALVLLAFAWRNYGAVMDGISAYRNPLLPTTATTTGYNANNTAHYAPSKMHLLGIHANGWASPLYVIASTLLLLGSIMWFTRGRNGTSDIGNTYQNLASIFWVVSGGIFIIGSIAHCISRR
jgi:hypothetical protein